MKMKLIGSSILIVLIVCLLFALSPPALAKEEIAAASAVGETMDFSGLEQFLQQMDEDMQTEGFRFSDLWQQFKSGNFTFSWQSLLNLAGTLFWREIAASMPLLAQLIVLAITALVLQSLQEVFTDGSVAPLTQSIIYLALVAISLATFGGIMQQAKAAISTMTDFIYAILPLLSTLLAAMGGTAGVALVHPMMLAALALITTMIHTIVFPLIYITVILKMLSQISSRFNIGKMASLCRDISLGLLTISLAVFSGFLGIIGFAGASVDGLKLKAAKMAVGTFVPVIGRSLADAMDTVMSTALLLKSALGVLGVLVILFICAFPAMKILVMSLLYRLVGAVIQPLGEERLSEVLSGLSSALTLVFAAVGAVGLLFFFMIAILVMMGNVNMMLR